MTLYRYTKNIERMEVNLLIDFKDFLDKLLLEVRFSLVCEISHPAIHNVTISLILKLVCRLYTSFHIIYSYNTIVKLYEFVSIYTITKKIVIENLTFLIDLQIKYWVFFLDLLFSSPDI